MAADKTTRLAATSFVPPPHPPFVVPAAVALGMQTSIGLQATVSPLCKRQTRVQAPSMPQHPRTWWQQQQPQLCSRCARAAARQRRIGSDVPLVRDDVEVPAVGWMWAGPSGASATRSSLRSANIKAKKCGPSVHSMRSALACCCT